MYGCSLFTCCYTILLKSQSASSRTTSLLVVSCLHPKMPSRKLPLRQVVVNRILVALAGLHAIGRYNQLRHAGHILLQCPNGPIIPDVAYVCNYMDATVQRRSQEGRMSRLYCTLCVQKERKKTKVVSGKSRFGHNK